MLTRLLPWLKALAALVILGPFFGAALAGVVLALDGPDPLEEEASA